MVSRIATSRGADIRFCMVWPAWRQKHAVGV